jgi:acyl dehydratase
VTRPISPRAALIYRLSGDFNPVHADPRIASEAGFERPILHGLCTFAMAAWSAVRELAGGDATALESVSARFKAPVLPGQLLRTELWRDGTMVRFRSYAADGSGSTTGCGERMVLDNGLLRLRGEGMAS